MLIQADNNRTRAAAVAGGALPGFVPASVNTRGVLVTMASNPGADTLNQTETVRRTGYTAAGGTTLTTWDEPVLIRDRARIAGATTLIPANLRPTEYVLSKALIAGDILVGRSIVNNSTRTAPIIEHRWVSPGYYVATTSDTSIAAFGTASGMNRNGTPVAFVIFKWDDGVTSVTTTVTTPSKRTCALTGLVGQVYVGVAPAGWSTLNDGQIRKSYTAYGHHGQVVSSDVTPANYYGAVAAPQFIRKFLATTFDTVYVYFNAAGTNTSTLGTSAGVNTTPGTSPAIADCYPLTTAGYENARLAATNRNNSENAINALDGVVMRLKGDGTGTGDIGTWASGTSVTRNCLTAGITIEADPNEYTSYKPIVTMDNFNFQLGGATNPALSLGIVMQNLRVHRAAASGNGTMRGVTGFITHLRFKNCGYDGGAVTVAAIICTFSSVTFEDTTLTGFSAASNTHLLGTSSYFVNAFIGVSNTTGMNNMQVNAHHWLGTSMSNARTISSTVSPLNVHGQLLDASFIVNAAPTGAQTYYQINTGVTATRGHIYRNCLVEMLLAAGNIRFNGFSADSPGATNSTDTIGFQNCTFPGSLSDGTDAGANRINIAYLDAAGPSVDPRVHNWVAYSGTIMPMTANKGDKFAGTAAGNYDGWSDLGNGVCSSGNWLSRIQPSPSFNPDYFGTGSVQPTSGAVEQLPGFTSPQVATSFGGANGSGGGIYTLTPGAAARGAVAYIPDCLWDALGNDLPAGVTCTSPGVYAGA